MRTPARKSNPRATSRSERLRQAKAEQEAKITKVEEAIIETPPDVILPPIQEPGLAVTAFEASPLEIPQTALSSLATRINARFAVVGRHQRVLQDHLLAWSLDLAEAKRVCEAEKENFRKWCDRHLVQSFETVRKYVAIGLAPDPAAALEATRTRNKEGMKQLRERQQRQRAIAAPEVSHDPAPAPGMSASDEAHEEALRADAAAMRARLEDAPPLRNDRIENVMAGFKGLLVPDQVEVLKVAVKMIPREAALDALRDSGFVVVGFNLNTAAE